MSGFEEATLDFLELPPGPEALITVLLPEGHVVRLRPVTHSAHFFDVQGEPTRERQIVLRSPSTN